MKRSTLLARGYRIVDGVLHRNGCPVVPTLLQVGYYQTNKMYVHRVVACLMFGDLPPGMHIDHIDRDRTNNRPENLRIVTPSANAFNNAGHSDSRSGIRGVSYHAQHKGKKWRARLRNNKKEVFLGYHETKEQAAVAVEEYLACH